MWKNLATLVTGGASFIGSHLTDRLVEAGARVRVVDDLSSGKLENIQRHVASGRVEFVQADLRAPGVAREAVQGINVAFHLAADHGGRGYVDTHQAGPASNLLLDGLIFAEAVRARVDKVVYASSGCVYPNFLQGDPDAEVYLSEEMIGPPYDADNMYGWAKLMGELTLAAYCDECGLKGTSCRYFTVYGPRGVENHSLLALIAKAFVGQDPLVVWGDGTQVRNWTYVDDIVRGTMLAAERIDDGSAVNLGSMERVRVSAAVELILEYADHHPELEFLHDMPTGPQNRVADNARAHELLGWHPRVPLSEGLRRTMDWYFANKDYDEVRALLSGDRLTER